MDATPDIAAIASLIGDRARATILMALMGGKSLTATELARASGVTKQTTSSHLSKLVGASLVAAENSGRHRYFRLAGSDVGGVIENLMGLAHRVGAVQVDSGPVDPALRKARTCYDHLAGEFGVLMFDSLDQRTFIYANGNGLQLSEPGIAFCSQLGIDVDELEASRRPTCLTCLDWSARRNHLAGALGAALLDRFIELQWAHVRRGSRIVSFSATGERAFRARFSIRRGVSVTTR
jgi:DNA-binding transcriptional ArsR family regulator